MSASRLTRWINRYEGPLRVLAATLVLAVLAGLVATSVVLVRFYDQVRLTLPDAGALQDIELKVPSVVLSSDGAVIGEIFDEKRYPVKLDETSQDLRNAFVAAEDAQFYAHSGVDYGGMLRAFINYIGGDGPVQGGSTITQQLAKTLLLTREKTLTRKLKDILLALEIERIMDKSDILELYLNTIFLGNQSYGVEAAARNYFGLSAKNLSLGQSALIAGLAPAPSAYAPTTNMAAAKKRQRYVLTQMVRWGMISAAQADEALAEDIKVSRAKSPNTRVAPYFLEEVKKHLLEVFDQKTLESGGLKVYTTLHHGLQRTADDLVRKYLAQFGDRRGFKGRIASHGSDNVAAIRSLLSEPQPEQEFDVVRAIVVDLNPALDIALIVTQAGLGLVLAEDHKWALSASRSRQSRVLDLANILSIGDEVRVRQLKRGTPRRIQQGARQLSALNAHLEHYPSGPMHEGIRFYELTDVEQIEGALVVADAQDGAVRAVVGGSDFSQSQFNRAMLAKRQIGSSIKPLYFAHAFDQGFGLASQIDSPPIVLGDWKPDNYSGRFLGRQTLRSTVIHSYNVPSIQLFQALGSGAIAKHLGRLGLGIPEGDLSAALGSTGATLLEVVQAYTPFVRSGSVAELRLIDRVEDNQGKTLVDSLDRRLLPAPLLPLGAGKSPGGSVSVGLKAKADAGLESKETRDVLQVMTPEAAYLSFASLEDAVVFGTGNKARIQGVRVAGKTGTTNAYTDAWFIGMVPGLVGGVWVGFDDAKKSLGDGATGGHFAAPLWREVMVEAIKVLGQGQLDMPETIKLVGMDADTGALLEGESSGGQRVVVPAMEGYEPGSARLRHARGLLGDTPENEKPAGSEDRTPEQAPEEDTPNLRSLF